MWRSCTNGTSPQPIIASTIPQTGHLAVTSRRYWYTQRLSGNVTQCNVLRIWLNSFKLVNLKESLLCCLLSTKTKTMRMKLRQSSVRTSHVIQQAFACSKCASNPSACHRSVCHVVHPAATSSIAGIAYLSAEPTPALSSHCCAPTLNARTSQSASAWQTVRRLCSASKSNGARRVRRLR